MLTRAAHLWHMVAGVGMVASSNDSLLFTDDSICSAVSLLLFMQCEARNDDLSSLSRPIQRRCPHTAFSSWNVTTGECHLGLSVWWKCTIMHNCFMFGVDQCWRKKNLIFDWLNLKKGGIVKQWGLFLSSSATVSCLILSFGCCLCWASVCSPSVHMGFLPLPKHLPVGGLAMLNFL